MKAQLAYAVQTPLMFIIRDDGDRAVSYNGDGTNPSYNWILRRIRKQHLGKHLISCGEVDYRMKLPVRYWELLWM